MPYLRGMLCREFQPIKGLFHFHFCPTMQERSLCFRLCLNIEKPQKDQYPGFSISYQISDSDEEDPCFPNLCQNNNECLLGLCVCGDEFSGEFCEISNIPTTTVTTTSTSFTIAQQETSSISEVADLPPVICSNPDPNQLIIQVKLDKQVF